MRDHAGWTMSSKMSGIYVHLNGESSKILLEKKGIMKCKARKSIGALKPKQCPNCLEPNKPDSKFCVRCRMILSYDANHESSEEVNNKKRLSPYYQIK